MIILTKTEVTITYHDRLILTEALDWLNINNETHTLAVESNWEQYTIFITDHECKRIIALWGKA